MFEFLNILITLCYKYVAN